MSAYDTNQTRPPVNQEKSLIPDAVKTVLIFVLLVSVSYLVIDGLRYKNATKAQIAKMQEQIQGLENNYKLGEASISSQITNLKTDLEGAQEAVGTTKAEMKKTTLQIQEEGRKTKTELSQALANKADSSQVEAQVQAVRSDTDNKLGQVNTEVGGVKTSVATVKTDLENTRRDLEGTQRQLLDVRDTLTAAVAKNSSELSQLRLKGEREYLEFQLPRKNEQVKVEDVRIMLTKTDAKKGKFNLRVFADDSQLEKKDRLINEPMQFLVGQNRVRYEIVINWVQKDKAGGYLSVPKDKTVAAERSTK
jgi:chromosome segregation ATPase